MKNLEIFYFDSTNVTMLYTVVGTFFKFLLWYTSFIVAFAFSFYIMFHTDYTGIHYIFRYVTTYV